MSSKPTLKISVPSKDVRYQWTQLSDLPWTPDVILEIVQRYCDSQDHAKNYRHRAQLKAKLLKARFSQIELLAKASGMTVDEYLEVESANLSEASGE